MGVKVGGYWPGNVVRRLTNRRSAVALFDPDAGQLKAPVNGSYLTTARTAASSAVSFAHLTRKNAKVLGMIGAGFHSIFQLCATLEQRDFEPLLQADWIKLSARLICMGAHTKGR